MARVVAAFVIVPLLYPLSILLVSGEEGWAGAIWAASFTIPITVVIGIPLFFIFRKKAWWRWWQFALGGVLAGLVASLPPLLNSWEAAALFAFYFVPFGLAHSVVFWLIAVWRNIGLTQRSTGRAASGAPVSFVR